jgi:Flp pilus assembly pilin Flp
MLTAFRLLKRLVADECGQDLIEYGLLASIIAIAGVLLFPGIVTKMGNAFSQWELNVNNSWTPPNPVP